MTDCHNSSKANYSYRFLEHTTDLSVIVNSVSLEGIYAGSIKALSDFLQLKQNDRNISLKTQNLSIEETDNRELSLVSILNEVLFYIQNKHFSPYQLIEFKYEYSRIKFELQGYTFNESDFKIFTEIKSITFHELYLRKDADHQYEAHWIADL